MKMSELREMSDEQLEATMKEAIDTMFRLRVRSQTERQDAASEKQKNRRIVARVKTLLTEREKAAAKT